MTEVAHGTLLLVESNTTGTGRLFARCARDLGIEPVLVTADPGRYPYVALDGVRTECVDTSDGEAVLVAARRIAATAPVLGVTSSSEYYIVTAAATARMLGLPGPGEEAVRACRDKSVQRRRLAEAGMPQPRHEVVHDVAGAVAAARRIGFPVVLKPAQGSGSLGVRACADEEQTTRHASVLTAATVNERGVAVPPDVLVEQLLPGQEFSVEVFGGRAIAVVVKHLGEPPVFVETGHDVPAAVPPARGALLRESAERAAAVLGLGWGAVHVELRLDGDRPTVIEVNPRLAGGMIPDLVRRTSGVDLVADQVRAAVGLDPAGITGPRAGAAAIRFLTADRDAVLGGTDLTDVLLTAVREVPGVVDAVLYAAEGTRVAPATDFRGRVGHVIAEAATGPAAARGAERGRTLLSRSLRAVSG
ncbi:ATP-grasp domain-containing protein [Plantactinospora sp. CA-290183]|uniref:ATP-grasp domain-containing protein n=1 Tax=Plantactinospora sp. CA-290183 TaxID=3240006 RepID=UPI003D95083E